MNTKQQPLVPADVVADLAPLAGGGPVAYPEYKAKLLTALGPARLGQYGEKVYKATTAADSVSLGWVTFLFGVIVVVSGLAATILGGLAGDWLLLPMPRWMASNSRIFRAKTFVAARACSCFGIRLRA